MKGVVMVNWEREINSIVDWEVEINSLTSLPTIPPDLSERDREIFATVSFARTQAVDGLRSIGDSAQRCAAAISDFAAAWQDAFDANVTDGGRDSRISRSRRAHPRAYRNTRQYKARG